MLLPSLPVTSEEVQVNKAKLYDTLFINLG